MNENTSDANVRFGFNKPNIGDDKQDSIIPPVDTTSNIEIASKPIIKTKIDEDIEFDKEYIDYKKITISLVKSYSLYRKSNDKVLNKRKDFIGSSVNSSRTLSSNKDEVETYFPNLIGVSNNDPNFTMRVKQYLNNIKIPIDELGKSFDISFRYKHKRDYVKMQREEGLIEEEYMSTNRQDLEKLKAALKTKIIKINSLESTKWQFGAPINIEDYIIYRHCLLYNDVAKDIALINSDINIRFYFKDENKEADRVRKLRLEINKAKANYVSCIADNKLFDAIYIQYLTIKGLPITYSINDSHIDKEIKLDSFSNEDPIKFNKLFNDKDIQLKSLIETLIARGELIRYQFNQNITTPEGDFIGANMQEAVGWFKAPENTAMVTAFNNRLKNM